MSSKLYNISGDLQEICREGRGISLLFSPSPLIFCLSYFLYPVTPSYNFLPLCLLHHNSSCHLSHCLIFFCPLPQSLPFSLFLSLLHHSLILPPYPIALFHCLLCPLPLLPFFFSLSTEPLIHKITL